MTRMKETQGASAIGLRPEELRSLRRLLLARKAELMDSYSNLEDEARLKGKEAGELSDLPHHPADRGSDSFEQSLSLALLETESSSIREIDLALERMNEGTYGSCEECGNPIGRTRLRALPQATRCRTCKSLEESLN
jgi:RNA polymerase-binding protein DksA